MYTGDGDGGGDGGGSEESAVVSVPGQSRDGGGRRTRDVSERQIMRQTGDR